MTLQPATLFSQRRSAFALGLAALLALQFALVSVTFPLQELVTDTPLFHNDAAYHWYQMTAANEYAASGVLVGYDPYFSAGYPGGVTYNWSGKVPALGAVLLDPFVSAVVVYKLYVFLCALFAPLLVAVALRSWRFDATTVAVGTLLGFVLWWASMFRWFHTAGMVSFVFGSYAALAWSALLYRAIEGTRSLHTFGILLLGALFFLQHPHFPLNALFPVAAMLAATWRHLDKRRMLIVLASAAVVGLLPNLVWLWPMAQHLFAFSVGAGDPAPYQKIVDGNLIWQEALGLWRGDAHGTFLYPVLLGGAVFGAVAAPASIQRAIARGMIGAWAVCELFAAFGGALGPLAQLQPNRFAVFGYLLLCVPAALGAATVVSWRAAHGVRRWLAAAGIGSLALVTLYAANEIRREVSWRDVGHYGAVPPEVRPLGAVSEWILDWLATETSADARVLFEESPGRFYEGAHIAGFYASQSGRQFIGGPYPFAHFAELREGFAFGSPLAELPVEAFRRYLELYNVGWIVAYSEATRDYLGKLSEVAAVADTAGGLTAYRVDRVRSYFAEGSGRVEDVRQNRIVLSDLSGERVVLKFHYLDGLRAEPATAIEPLQLPEDPNPFIVLVDPPPRVVLSMQ